MSKMTNKSSMVRFLIVSLICMMVFIGVEPIFAKSVWDVETIEEPVKLNKEWKITFNEEIDKETVNTNNIYILDNKGDRFNAIEVSLTGERNALLITPLTEYLPDTDYSIYITEELNSIYGQPMDNPMRIDFKTEEDKSPYFKIRNVEQVTSDRINVYFTHPIDESATLELYYSLLIDDGKLLLEGNYKNMEISLLNQVDNGISILFKDYEFEEGRTYTLDILGDLPSAYGARLNNGEGDSKLFIAHSTEAEQIQVTNVGIVGNKTLAIDFSKEVDKKQAENVGNFIVKDERGRVITIDNVVVDENGKTILINFTNALSDEYQYEVIINYIRDRFNLSEIKGETHYFQFDSSKDKEIQIIKVTAISNKELEVILNMEPHEEDAVDEDLFIIKGLGNSTYGSKIPYKVYYNKETDPMKLRIFLSKELRDDEYQLRMSRDFRNKYGYSREEYDYYEFDGTKLASPELQVESAVIIGDSQIMVKLTDEVINSDKLLNTDNYILKFEEDGDRVTTIACSNVVFKGPNTLILTFNGIKNDEMYNLEIKSIHDLLGQDRNIFYNGITFMKEQE